jgi:two-component system, LytTR family, response regulator
MFKAIIIDDEKHCTDTLEILIQRNCPDVQITGITNDPLEGVELIRRDKPDLVFLDIEMRHLNGFGVLEQTQDQSFGVIFTTAYDEFAISAIKHSALDYLLKPIDKDELTKAVSKASHMHQGNEVKQHINDLFARLENDANWETSKIALSTMESVEIVSFKDIMRCEADNNYTFVHLTNESKILVSKTLKEISDKLNSKFFFRTHKSHLVNLLEAKKYVRGAGGYLVMSDGKQVPVARSKKDELLEWLNLVH